MRGDDRSDGLAHALPRSERSAIGKSGKRVAAILIGKDGFAITDCTPERRKFSVFEASGVPLCTSASGAQYSWLYTYYQMLDRNFSVGLPCSNRVAPTQFALFLGRSGPALGSQLSKAPLPARCCLAAR